MIDKQTLRKILFRIKPLKLMWKRLSWLKASFFLRINPKVIANNSYKSVFKKNINWNKPVDLIEKIFWLQLYSDTSLWSYCADKYLVRDFVKEKGCGDALNELYGKWDNASKIDWPTLPVSFVLKANHSCGQVILVKDKRTLDINQTTIQLNNWMKSKYGYSSAQLHYLRIKPCIIAEKMFENKNETSKSLIDYKVWCFHGKPECVLVAYNRTDDNYSLSFYDLEWNNISSLALNKDNRHYDNVEIPKPLSFDSMIRTAKKLSKGFPQVRVDFFDIDGKAIFGEMTFTTGFGSYSEEYYRYLGSKIDLSKVKKLAKPNTI